MTWKYAPMNNYWSRRLQEAEEKSHTARLAETRRIHQTMAEHYRQLDMQCRRAGLDCDGEGGFQQPSRLAA